MESTPDTPEALKDLGNTLFKERRYVEALRTYEQALNSDSAYLPAMYNKAMTLLKLNLAGEACLTIEKGLTLAPEDERLMKLKVKCEKELVGAEPDFFHSKGENFFRLGRYEDAILAYNKAIQMDPAFVPSLSSKSRALEYLERIEEASEAIDAAYELDPKDSTIVRRKTRVDIRIEKRRIMEHEPDDGVAVGMKHLGDALFRGNKLLQAISKYDVAIDRDPGYVAAWFNKGQAFRRLKNQAEAKMCFDQALTMDPDNELVAKALEAVDGEITERHSIEASMKESEAVYEDALSKISLMLERTRDIDKDYDKITGLIHDAERVIESGSKYADMSSPRKLIKGALKMLSDDNYEKAETYATGARKKALKAIKEGKSKYELATKEIEYVEKTVREMMDAGVGIPQVRALQDRAEEEVFRKNFDEALKLAKEAHKLALEEAEKALVILKTTDKEYQQARTRMSEAEEALDEAKVYNVVGDMEGLFDNAQKAFDEGDYISAEVYAKMVIEQSIDAVGAVRSDRQGVENDLQKVRDLMSEVEDAGVDLSQSLMAIERAEAALDRGDIEEGHKYASLGYTATMKIVEETLNDIKIEGGAYKDTLAVIRATADVLKKANQVGDVSELEEALQEAYASLDEDNYFRAMSIATDIMAAAEDYDKERRGIKDEALRKMVAVETAIDRFKGQDISMSDAETIVDSAPAKIDAKEFEEAMEIIERANELAKKAAGDALRRK